MILLVITYFGLSNEIDILFVGCIFSRFVLEWSFAIYIYYTFTSVCNIYHTFTVINYKGLSF